VSNHTALENTPNLNDSQIAPKDDLSQALQLLNHIRDGGTLKSAAEALGVSVSTAYRRLQLIEVDESGVVKLLRLNELKLLDDWMKASEKAAEKGDHRPAKDALLHAKAIEPVNDNQGGTRIAIVIGTPDQPIRVSPPQVIQGESESQ
jgi:hypothetical protein